MESKFHVLTDTIAAYDWPHIEPSKVVLRVNDRVRVRMGPPLMV